MLAYLMMMLLSQQSPTPTLTMMDGLMNGDFEYLLDPAAKLDPPNATLPVDGGFWVGAETHTEKDPVSGTRFLALKPSNSIFGKFSDIPEAVYQRVGCVQEHTLKTKLGWSARVDNGSDEARITVGEATGKVHSLEWSVTPGSLSGDEWKLYMTPPGGGIVGYVASAGNAIGFRSARIAPDTTLWAVWTAKKPGWVRIVMRPRRWDASCPSACDLETEILHDTDGFNQGQVGTSIGESLVPDSETEGVVRILRHWVDDGDQLAFRLTNTDTALGSLPHTLNWSPYIIEEARRVVYRFATQFSYTPANDATTTYRNVVIPSQSWTHSPLGSSGALDVGADFFNAFGSAPVPPLEVVLEAIGGNITAVDFDNIECAVGFDTFTESELREEILAEAALVRERQQRNLDTGLSSNSSATGLFATPYLFPPTNLATWGNIPHMPTEGYIGGDNGHFPRMLSHSIPYRDQHYVEQDHLDWSWLHQQHLRSRTATGFQFDKFALKADLRNTDTSSYGLRSTGQSVDAQLKAYKQTGDPESLDLAFDCAMTMVEEGVIPATNPNTFGLIQQGGYKMQSGLNVMAELPNHQHVTGLSRVLRTYSACRLYNEETALLSPPRAPRYDVLKLQALLDIGETAAAAAKVRVDLSDGLSNGASYDPEKTWHEKVNLFDDKYGNQASNALDAFEALSEWALDPQVSVVRGNLKKIFYNGALYFLDLEEQSMARAGFEPGDETRGAIGFLGAAFQHTTANDPIRARIETALMRWAFYCLKFQAPGGIWTQGSRESFQLLDYSHQYFGIAGMMMPDQAPGLVSKLLGAETSTWGRLPGRSRDDLITLLSSYLTVSREHFFDQYPQYPQIAYYMNGWSPYLVPPTQIPLPPPVGVEFISGWEIRLMSALLEGASHMTVGLAEAPQVSVTPEDFLPAPPVSTIVPYAFTVYFPDVPTSTNSSALNNALNQRVIVEQWATPAPVAGPQPPDQNWRREELWPALPGAFSVSLNAQTSTATLTLKVPYVAHLPGLGNDLKFTVRAWNDDGLWDEAITYQEDW